MRGDHAGAAGHGRAALPVLERLGARDDVVQLRGLLALGAIAEGRLDDAEDELREIDRGGPVESIFGGRPARAMGGAELLLARGRRSEGLEAYRAAVAEMRTLTFPGMDPTGMEPWVVFAESAALAAFARHAAPEDVEEGRALARSCRERLVRTLRTDDPYLDHPVAGLALFALAAWALLREDEDGGGAAAQAVRLLVLADRFAYNRAIPSMAWAPIAARAEQRAPGRVAAVCAETEGLRGPALLRAGLEALGQTRLE